MKNKIIAATIIDFLESCVGLMIIILLKTFTQLPLAMCIVIGAPITIFALVIGYFIGRCPECHMPLNWEKGAGLFEHCPYCGNRL